MAHPQTPPSAFEWFNHRNPSAMHDDKRNVHFRNRNWLKAGVKPMDPAQGFKLTEVRQNPNGCSIDPNPAASRAKTARIKHGGAR